MKNKKMHPKKKLVIKPGIPLEDMISCGFCGRTTSRLSKYSCKTCGRMMCGKCGDFCENHFGKISI